MTLTTDVHLADIDGDGLADYIYVDMLTGEMLAWTNDGPIPAASVGSAFTFTPRGTVAYGGAARGSCVNFGNIHGEGRADYIVVDPQAASAITFWNVCSESGDVGPVAPDLPSVPVAAPTTAIPVRIFLSVLDKSEANTKKFTTTAPEATPTFCHQAADPDQGYVIPYPEILQIERCICFLSTTRSWQETMESNHILILWKEWTDPM